MKPKKHTAFSVLSFRKSIFSNSPAILVYSVLLLLGLFINNQAYSQPVGDVCGDPIVVSELPFYAELNTADFSNDYSSSNIPSAGPWADLPYGLDKTWANGKDIVFEYVADTTMLVEIELTELEKSMAIYVIQGCPFAFTMGFNKSTWTSYVKVSNFQILAGVTYYILATTPSASVSANTTFKINIRQQDTQDCPDANANFGELCDDGDETTLNDMYHTNCQCEGDATVEGAVCENPIEINGLPFIQEGSLEPYGNYYSAADIAPTIPGYIRSNHIDVDYINGNEVVFSYTPTQDQLIDINLGRIDYLSLYIFKGCQFTSTHAIFNPNSSRRFGAFSGIPLLADSTYFFVVSTNSNPPNLNYAAQNFHIEVRETGVFDCADQELNINGRCDDGDALTFPDITDAECNCVGTPTTPGQICANPLPILELPFHASDTTAKYGNNYSDIDFPAETNSYAGSFNGTDVVFSYTPSRDEIIDLTLTHPGKSGIFVFVGCPFVSLVAAKTGTSSFFELKINDLNLLAGVTYYIVLTGNDYHNPNQVFTLDITLEWAYCPEFSDFVYQPCDDGDLTTIRDSITYNCECAGKPTIPGEYCGNPIEISSLPAYISDSTYYYGNNYSDADLPTNPPLYVGNDYVGSTYLDGNDVVYTYTPLRNEIIRISPIDIDNYTGIYVLAGCPFDSTIAVTELDCCKYNYQLIIDSLYLSEGTTYYIVVSSAFTFNNNNKYNLQIDLLWAYCEEFDLPVFSPCDDGIETTIDSIDENCECVGLPTIPGQFCGNPLPVDLLPFTTTDSVDGYGDAYNGADFPPLAPGAITNNKNNPGYYLYLYYPEVVYSYTPNQDELLTITLSNASAYTGLFVFSGCPFISTEAYYIGASDIADQIISPLPVLEGITYYIVVSSDGTLQQEFTLTIEAADWDCYDLQVNFGESCDDGDPDTENDLITDACVCAGTPIDYDCVNTKKYPIFNVSPDPNGAETPVASCVRIDEYSQISGIYTGHSYAFAGVINSLGTLSFITVRRDSVNGPVLGAGFSPLIINAVSDADLFVHWNIDAGCGTSQANYLCVNANMVCITCPAIIDCEGVINGNAVAGTSCDDNDPNTLRDKWNGNCECVGETPIPLSICESAVPLACNGEPTTYQSLDGTELLVSDCSSGVNGFWFTFTGNGGNIELNFSSTFLANVSIFEGDCSTLNPIGCILFYEEIDSYQILNSVPGQSYYVYMAYPGSMDITTGSVTISILCETILNGSVNSSPNCNNRSATLSFYQPGTATLVSAIATSIDQNGHFEILNPPIGTYDLILNANVSLNIGIPNYEVNDGENILDFGSLKPGDINNDNAINVIDISYVNLSFGKSIGDTFFDPRADSNCDGIVNIVDLSILNMSYLKTGASAPLNGN